MSTEEDKPAALVPAQSTALVRAGARSLVARGRADLMIRDEAEACLKRGLELRDRGGYEEAFACFERGIQLNPSHPEVQFMLGLSLDNGEGTTSDHAQARIWYRKAAEQGIKEAQYNLGLLYYRCDGGPGSRENYEEAAQWFRKAAEQGYERAQSRLSLLYGLGLVTPQDHEWEVNRGRREAEQGDVGAQRILGDRYRYGRGVPQDHAEAASWYRKAAQIGDLAAQISLAQMYSQGLVPLGVYFGFAFTEANCEDAKSHLALDEDVYLRHGSKEAAAYWFAKAAQLGSEIAALALADLQPLITLERAKRTIEMSAGVHFNFGRDVEARKKHYAAIQEAVRVLTDAGYKVKSAGFGYELEDTQ